MKNKLSIRVLLVALIGVFAFSAEAVAAKDKDNTEVSIKRRIEPNYPTWAYNEGIGQGYAKIAFYVNEYGETSEYLVIEYSHEAFADELLKIVPSWRFEPAHRQGKPIKSVCHVYWEFLPDRAIVTNAFYDTSKRIDGRDSKSFRNLKFYSEAELDHKPKMLTFPGVVIPDGYKVVDSEKMQIAIRCDFFVDTEGNVALPTILSSSDPYLDEEVIIALKGTSFEPPVVDGERTIAWLEKTYAIPLVSPVEIEQ